MGCAIAREQAVQQPLSSPDRYLNDQIGDYLTKSQISIVKTTWAAFGEDLGGSGLLVFTRLFQTDPEMRDLFHRLMMKPGNYGDGSGNIAVPRIDEEGPQSFGGPASPNSSAFTLATFDQRKLQRHGLAVMQALGAAVDCLEDALMLNSVLLSLGQAHHSFQIKPEYLMRLWPAVNYVFQQRLGRERYTNEAEKAWRKVFRYVTGKMEAGMQIREAERRSFNAAR